MSPRATITTTRGRVYVADEAAWRGRRLVFRGRLRVTNRSGRRFYETRSYDLAAGEVRRIDWHRDSEQAS